MSAEQLMEALHNILLAVNMNFECRSSTESAVLPGENTWLQHKVILFILSRTYQASVK